MLAMTTNYVAWKTLFTAGAKVLLEGKSILGLEVINSFTFRRRITSQFHVYALSKRLFGPTQIRNFKLNIVLYADVVIKVPPFPESVSEGDVRWEKKEGDQVAKDEVVCEIETDKTAIPVPSPVNGILSTRMVPESATVKAGQEIYKVTPGAAPPPKAKEQPHAQTPQQKPPSAPPKPLSTPKVAGTRTETRVKMTPLRKTVSKRLKESQNTFAMLTTFNEIDMSVIMEFRRTNQEAFKKKYGIKMGFMSAFLKASAYGLVEQPIINAVIDGNVIVYRDYVDISVAVAGRKGLFVPVVRNVEMKSHFEVEQEIVNFGVKAKTGNFTKEEMQGGTFTVSNGGVFGSMMGTPIINPPQSAILGMHGIFERPIAVKSNVVIRPMMYVALTYDHRLVDGREAVIFLKKIKAAVEDPRIIMFGL